MRSVILFLVVAVAFLAVRWFRGGPVAGAVEATAPSEAGVRFLEPPAPARAAEAEPVPSVPAVESEPVREAETTWPTNLPVEETAIDGEEIKVAAALVHGTPAEVQAVAASFPRDRALLLESFSWAAAGERDLALSLAEKIGDKGGVDGRERELFEAAVTGRVPAPGTTSSEPVPLAMEMTLLAREAKRALLGKKYPEAARAFSSLLLGEIGAPWPPDRRFLAEWTQGLDEAQREYRWNPRAQWPAVEVKVQGGDTLIGIRLRHLAEHPEARLCTGLIERANRLKGYLQPNQVLKIPTDPVRVVVDLDACWALFLMGDEVSAAWPVGVGRPGEETPPGNYTVRNKLENPPWMKEGQDPIPFGDPRNPLGTRWLGWDRDGGKTSYGFHGTWDPESIGQAASDGCVRFLNEDVEELFQILPEGAPIQVQA